MPNLLERAFPDNVELQEGVSNLVSRKTQWKQRLEEKWLNRRQPVFDEFDVRRTCYMYQVLQQEKDRLSTAQNMPNLQIVKSSEWIIKARNRPWFGWCPFSKSFMSFPILYGETPDYSLCKHCIIKESKSNAVDIVSTLQNLIEYRESMGFGSNSYQVIWLAFVQNELPESLSSIARFAGNTDKVFSSITDLIHGSFEEEKIRSTIRSLTRPAFENLAVLVNKVRSLFIALYNINHTTMDEKKILPRLHSRLLNIFTSLQCKSKKNKHKYNRLAHINLNF